MRKGTGKPVVCMDRFTMETIAVFPSVKAASEATDVREGAIYLAISTRMAACGCFWVYVEDMNHWRPEQVAFKKNKNIKMPLKLQKLLGYES